MSSDNSELLADLKSCISQACTDLRVEPRNYYRLVDLKAFWVEVSEIDCPKRLATITLAHLQTDGIPARYVGCLAAHYFLLIIFEASASRPNDLRMGDLKQLIDNQVTDEAVFQELIDGWYA